jgi:hypothetical protein
MRDVCRTTALVGALACLAGCGPVRVETDQPLPTPLVEQEPVTIAVCFPDEFRTYVHKETRYKVDYEIALGQANVERLRRMLSAMFRKVVEVDDPAHALATDPAVRMVVEPRFEEYAFLTPQDVAGDAYTVTIRYRLNLYDPDGTRVDGYLFTGYGRARSSGMSGTGPLKLATQMAMRDAAAKLAVEFTSQKSVRRLIAGGRERPDESPLELPAAEPDATPPAPPEAVPRTGEALPTGQGA